MMLTVLLCLVPVLVLFAAMGALDKRFPDRLSRRGRHLAGLSEEATASRTPGTPSSRDIKASGERGTPKSVLFTLALQEAQRRHWI
jgi:hypothetical protein